MKHALAFLLAISALATTACKNTGTNPLATIIQNPGVQAQVIGDVEKDAIAGGGALLFTGGSGTAAVAALSAQELKNLPQLQAALENATPATVTTAPALIPVPVPVPAPAASPAPVASK